MKNTGQILKTEREKKKLSLHEIGMSLKINPKTLQALEEGDLTKLPAKSFLRGFVKSYAKYLKLNENEILESFHKEMFDLSDGDKGKAEEKPGVVDQRASAFDQPSQVAKAASLKKSDPRPPLDANQETLFANKIFVGSGVAVLVFMIVITAKLFDKYQKERQIDKAQIENVQAADLKGTDSAAMPSSPPLANSGADGKAPIPTAEGETKEVAEPAPAPIAPTPTPVAVVPAATSNTPTTSPVAEIKQKVAAKEETKSEEKKEPRIEKKKDEKKEDKTNVAKSTPPLTEESKSATSTKDQNLKPAPIKGLPKNPTEIIVEALNKVQIKYSLGDGKTQVLELNPDQVHTFKSKSFVEIEISDGGSVSLIVNGRERGVPGSIGKPVKLTYPKL